MIRWIKFRPLATSYNNIVFIYLQVHGSFLNVGLMKRFGPLTIPIVTGTLCHTLRITSPTLLNPCAFYYLCLWRLLGCTMVVWPIILVCDGLVWELYSMLQCLNSNTTLVTKPNTLVLGQHCNPVSYSVARTPLPCLWPVLQRLDVWHSVASVRIFRFPENLEGWVS